VTALKSWRGVVNAFGADRPSRGHVWLITLVLVGLSAAVAARSMLYINFTRSLPIGVYRRVAGAPTRGDLVVACLPAAAGEFARLRGYVWRGDCPGGAAPLGKVVLAERGDTVEITASGILVNGVPIPNTRLMARDSKGRPVPHVQFGRHIVGAGELWLFSPYHVLSFDSRYFGPIGSRGVRARVRPLLTSGRPAPAALSSLPTQGHF
jgi:conjugative transfer signal peptidase TraF